MPTQNFRVGELLNKRTRNSKTWINFDGSYTTEIYTTDVHYQDENGNWHNINTDLYDEADLDQVDFPVAKEGAEEFRIMKTAALNLKKKNILDRDSLDFQGLKVPFDCRIPRNFKRGYVIGKGQHKLRFIPVGVSPTKGFLDENQKNKITYQDPWNDVDVTLEVLPNGIKETIILKSSESPTKFTFEVDGPLEDDLTAGNLKLQPAWLKDANGEKRDVLQTIRRENGKTFVDIVTDVTGLTYPIEIDPTVTIQPDRTAGIDTYINQNYPSTNYGESADVYIGVNDNLRCLVVFDVSGIPAGSVITKADLELYKLTYINTSTIKARAYLITQSWTESGVTWSNQPSFDINTYSDEVSWYTETTGEWVKWDIKNIVQRWVDGTPNYGVMIKQTNSIAAGNSFVSSEHASANKPKLTITYNLPPTAPTVTSPNGGETWNAQHTITWNPATDESTSDTTITFTTDDSTVVSGWKIVGQIVTVDFDGYIKQVSLLLSEQGANYSGVLSLRNAELVSGSNYKAGSTIYASKRFDGSVPYGTYTLNINPPLKFAKGTKLAIDFEFDAGQSGVFYGSTTDKYPGGNIYYANTRGSESVSATKDINGSLVYDEDTPQSSLQYQIQLSPDNGQTWKDIVALTNPGATSYTYDFTNEPETSLAKIRIRAYDGTSYGPWDESDGVFTIQHNVAPTVPTNLSPSGGTSVDRASVVRLSWQHNDPNSNDPQSQFDLQWRKQGDATWNDVSQVTTNQYWDAPAGTFPRGTIEWRVRTYDQAGLSSPYSDIQTFFAGDKPANPTVTDPIDGATVPVARPTVQWSSVGQTAYHVKVLDVAEALLWEIQANSPNKAQTVLYDLQNNTDYQIRVAIKNADNLWSDFVTSNIHVSYTPPAVPIVTTSKGEGVIIVSIDNPTPSGTQPNVSYNDLYRRKQGESTWIRIANIPADASFVDYTPASGQVYEYFVRAWGDNGTYSDSSVVSESISLTGVWLHEADNPLETLHQFKLVSERSENWQPTAAMMQFAGRRLPVAEYDDTEQRTISMKITVLKNSDDREAIERLIRSKNTLCYRDARGRKMFCHAFQLPVDDETYGNTVSLTFEEVSYTEEV
jgi:hypothetical protein